MISAAVLLVLLVTFAVVNTLFWVVQLPRARAERAYWDARRDARDL